MHDDLLLVLEASRSAEGERDQPGGRLQEDLLVGVAGSREPARGSGTA
jgi:hypothetical protein